MTSGIVICPWVFTCLFGVTIAWMSLFLGVLFLAEQVLGSLFLAHHPHTNLMEYGDADF